MYNLPMRKFIVALVLFLGVAFVILRIGEVEDIIQTLQRGHWFFILLGFVVVGLYLGNIALCFKVIFKSIGINEQVRYLLPVALASIFISVVAPSAGMSSMAVFISEAQRRNYSPGKAAVGGALYILFDYAAFFCVLTLGFIVLIRRNNLNVGEIISAIILVVIALFVALLIYLGMHSAEKLGRVLSWLGRLVNRVLRPFIKREYLSEARAYEFATEASEGLRELTGHPKKLFTPMFFALTKQGLMVSILCLSFLAFRVPISIGTLIAGYSIAYLVLIVSPTPSGVGFVEGTLPVILSSMYIPWGTAAVITLTYRAFTFWLPLLAGMIGFRWLGSQKAS